MSEQTDACKARLMTDMEEMIMLVEFSRVRNCDVELN
jgi:hypothetical protein